MVGYIYDNRRMSLKPGKTPNFIESVFIPYRFGVVSKSIAKRDKSSNQRSGLADFGIKQFIYFIPKIKLVKRFK